MSKDLNHSALSDQEKEKYSQALLEYVHMGDYAENNPDGISAIEVLKTGVPTWEIADTITIDIGLDLGDGGLSIELLQRYVPHWVSMLNKTWLTGSEDDHTYFDYVMAMNVLTTHGILESGVSIRCSWPCGPVSGKLCVFGDESLPILSSDDATKYIAFICWAYEEFIKPRADESDKK